jgi:hypothetical protein
MHPNPSAETLNPDVPNDRRGIDVSFISRFYHLAAGLAPRVSRRDFPPKCDMISKKTPNGRGIYHVTLPEPARVTR